ncbi:MAG: hypothetical protein IJ375_06060 [Oscillospiraceae bacterium]|nr:hypothetical protein [Oscillospiraceae bacterium]
MKLAYKKGTGPRLILLAAAAVAFLLLFSGSTSPLTDFVGADSAFFRLVGKGMTEGRLPYRDFFDMKGPWLFLIEYLGQLIWEGRTGAFIMQCLNLILSLWITDGIFRLRLEGKKYAALWEALGILACLVYTGGTLEYGNLTEEFSLPWLLLAVYFALRYLKRAQAEGDYSHSPAVGFYYGFAFGVMALIRVTNAAVIGAVLLAIAPGLLVKKEYKNLLLNGLAFLLGCAGAFAPMCVYYAAQGLLGEMLEQVFLFGVQYSAEVSLAQKARSVLSEMTGYVIIAVLPLVPLAVRRERNWQYWVLAASSCALLLLAAAMGNAYLHYFTLGVPNLVLGLALLPEEGEEKGNLRQWVPVLIALVMLLLPARTTLKSLQRNLNWMREAASGVETAQSLQIRDIVSHIPESDYDSVYAYGMGSCSGWYAQAGLLPAHRYCDWQAHYIELNPEIEGELAQWMAEEQVRWIVLPADYEPAPARIARALEDHYQEYARNGAYVLLTAKG